jgi:prevent-host-death family protein
MQSINITNARKKIYSLVKEVNEAHQPLQLTSKQGAVVMVSKDDWNAIQETLFLCSIPGMRESIMQGMKEPISKCSKKLDW